MRASLFDNDLGGAGGGDPVSGSGEGIFDKAVLLSVEIGRFGIKRGVASGAVEVQADKTMIDVSKKILASPELKKIAKFDNEVRRRVATWALPSQFRSGVYLIPLGLVSEADDYLNDRESARVALVARFMEVYTQRINEARESLQVLFNIADYPSAEAVERKFFLNHRWVQAAVPGRLSTVSKALWLREEEKARASWASAREEGVQALREGFQALVDHMIERLTPSEDGKPKVFKKSLVENLDSFMGELFTAKNSVLNDDDLAALVSRGRELLQGVESKDLKSQALASSIRAGFEGIKTRLDGMVAVRPGRKLDLSEDGEDW